MPTFACALLLGFLGSAPSAGPATYVAIARAAARGRGAGLRVALGAAIAEAIYASCAFVASGALAARLGDLERAARGAGAIALLAFGLALLAAGRQRAPAERWPGALVGFLLVAVNPVLVATWGAALAALRASGWAPAGGSVIAFGCGFAAGVIAWFGVLLTLLRRLPAARLLVARRVLGGAFVLGGIAAGARACW